MCNSEQLEKFIGVESLMHDIFNIKKYNNLVRPIDKNNNLTNILAELKLLQIDLVKIHSITIIQLRIFKIFK